MAVTSKNWPALNDIQAALPSLNYHYNCQVQNEVHMQKLDLFPDSAQITGPGLNIGGCNLPMLAETYGTPLYLYDRLTMDASVEMYRQALVKYYPGETGLTYAGKAWLCLAAAQWTMQQNLWLDCTGRGEIAIAAAAGVDRSHLLVHGVNKSLPDLESAIHHAGTIVVDNLNELERLVILSTTRTLPDLWLRFQPGVEVETHAHTLTGHAGSKFGMDREALLEAARICRRNRMPLKGLHFHLGSQFRQASPLQPAIEFILELAAEVGFETAWTLSPGGGWGVAYHESELPQPDMEEYIHTIVAAVVHGCEVHRLPLPRLQLEPGRSLVARAGVALYRVGTVKHSAGRTWVLLDGGMSDNPRPALYAAKYSALCANRPSEFDKEPVCLAGPYCESGDVLIMDIPMPCLEPGDLIAVPVSGAYQLSMSGNYNGSLRPAVLWLDNGNAYLIQQREAAEDLLRRDIPLL